MVIESVEYRAMVFGVSATTGFLVERLKAFRGLRAFTNARQFAAAWCGAATESVVCVSFVTLRNGRIVEWHASATGGRWVPLGYEEELLAQSEQWAMGLQVEEGADV